MLEDISHSNNLQDHQLKQQLKDQAQSLNAEMENQHQSSHADAQNKLRQLKQALQTKNTDNSDDDDLVRAAEPFDQKKDGAINMTSIDFDQECRKLRESYSQHRRQRNGTASRSRSRGATNVRASAFKRQDRSQPKVAFETMGVRKSRDVTPDSLIGDKENAVVNTSQNNPFKRHQKQNEKSLANYQEKYNRLEENFKKFTQSLQDKRSGSNTALNRSQQIAAQLNSGVFSDQNSSMVSPTNSNFYQHRLHVQSNGSLPREQHLNFGNNVTRFVPDQNQTLAQSASYSLVDDLPQENQSRTQMLQVLVARLNNFVDSSFEKLLKLCVSKQQENQVLEFEKSTQRIVQDMAQTVRSGAQDSDQQQLESLYRVCLDNLEACFTQIIQRIFSVESETFKNYKFKEVLLNLESIMQESHSLNLVGLMPKVQDCLVQNRIRAGAALMKGALGKHLLLAQKRRFNRWRASVGMINMLTQSRKQRLFSQAIRRMVLKSQYHVQLRSFQQWKLQSISNQKLGSDLVSKLFTDSIVFSECLQKDEKLSYHISQSLEDAFGVKSDLLFLSNEVVEQDDEDFQDEEEEVLTGYQADGSTRQCSMRAIQNSLTYQAITNLKEGKSFQCESIFGRKHFNEQVDTPLVELDLNAAMTVFSLHSKAFLRVFSAQTFSDKMQNQLKEQATQIAEFIDRIQHLRWQLGTLTENLQQKQDLSASLELEKYVYDCLFDILEGVQKSTKEEFLELLQQRISKMLQGVLPGAQVRQIYRLQLATEDAYVLHRVNSTALLPDCKDLCLIRQRDHQLEKKDILEDFLDHLADKTVHQISLETTHFKCVFHRELPKCDSNLFNLSKAESINQNVQFVLQLLGRCMQPVLLQGLTIHEDLASKVKAQATNLSKQVELQSMKDQIRSDLTTLQPGVSEDVFVSTLDSSLRSQTLQQLAPLFEVKTLSLCFNQALISGGSLSNEVMIGYLTVAENMLLEMPDEIHSNPDSDKSRYQAPVSQFATVKQELTAKKDGYIFVQLPITFKTKELMVCIKMELIQKATEREDQQNSIKQLKQFLTALNQECTTVLSDVVYSQAVQSNQFRECYEQMQVQLNSLTIDVDFMNALQNYLVLPFVQSPTLKTLGIAMNHLIEKMLVEVRTERVSLVQDKHIKVADIRKLTNCMSQDDQLTAAPEQPLSFTDQTISMLIDTQTSLSLLINLTVEDLSKSQMILQQCEVFNLIVQPFVKSALGTMLKSKSLLPVNQEHLPRVLTSVINTRKIGYIYNFFSKMKELQTKRVPIFTRLKSYQSIVKRKYHTFGIEEQVGYGEEDKREYLIRERVLSMYTNAFKKMTDTATKMKKRYFDQYKHQVIYILQSEQQVLHYFAEYQPSKLQRKAVSQIYRVSKKLSMQARFAKWVIVAANFHRLNNPDTKMLAAMQCLAYNHAVIRQRLSFQKLRSNASNACHLDYLGAGPQDRQQLVKWTKILLDTNIEVQDSSFNLENSMMTVLENAITYLQEQLCPETLDCIIVSIQKAQSHQPSVDSMKPKKARAYVFNNKLLPHQEPALAGSEKVDTVIDGLVHDNINVLVQNLEGLTDFNLSFKKDIILQMLLKSKTMFNFRNINESLYSLYLNHLGKQDQPDKEVVQRMMVVKKSKSALILPLIAISGLTSAEQVVGSLELYRFHQQEFNEDVEQRIKLFASILGNDVLPVYFKLRENIKQMDALRRQLSRNSKQKHSLTSLLRQVHFTAPVQLNATQIHPIILNQVTKHAYFYQFKDNHVYNFGYQDTFIGEIAQYMCILELASQGHEESEQESDRSMTSSQMVEEQYMEMNQDVALYNHVPGHRRRNIDGLVKSVTNEPFRHILYYPVVGGVFGNQCKAIIEVCFENTAQVPLKVLTPQIQTFLENFSSQLSTLETRIKSFCKFTESVVQRKDGIKMTKAFQTWKSKLIFENQKKEFLNNQKQTINQTENCFNEYVRSLECYDTELKKLVDDKQEMTNEIHQLRLERQAKLKFLGAALIMLSSIVKKQKKETVRSFFNKWKMNHSLAKIAAISFNKILELNHRHSEQRFNAACKLLERSICRSVKRDTFNSVIKAVNMTGLSSQGISKKEFTEASIIGGNVISNTFRSSEHYNRSNKFITTDQFTNMIGPFARSHLQASANKVKKRSLEREQEYLQSASPNNSNTMTLANVSGIDSHIRNISMGQHSAVNQTSMCYTPTMMTGFTNGTNNTEAKIHTTQDSHIKQLHKQMGFGAVPQSRKKSQTRMNASQSRSRSRSTNRIKFHR